VIDKEALVHGKLLELARWVASRYRASLGDTLDCMLPGAVRKGKRLRAERTVALAVPEDEALAVAKEFAEKHPARSALLYTLLELDEPMSPAGLAASAGVSASVVGTLERAGLVRVTEHSYDLIGNIDASVPERLTPEQTKALVRVRKMIDSHRHATALVYGVTGSGKTELYIRVLQDVLFGQGGEPSGKQAIVLVPEISLTPQTVARFAGRIGEVGVLHSHLTAGQRNREWQRIRSGEARLVVGARSAVFAPTRDLGVIIIDEEHETSFKQDRAPRYHAREVAAHRAQMENVPLILGSATPSLESFSRAVTGKYSMLVLSKRVKELPLPPVEIVDMRKEKGARRTGGLISEHLVFHLERTLKRGNQAMLLLNRRGFARHVVCRRCGFVLKCRDCDIALTYHKKNTAALCHYCDHVMSIPGNCPDCVDGRMRYGSFGTERVEEDLGRLFPDAVIARMDSDTMRKRGSHARVLGEFRAGRIDILIGTQMIAKGLDFPNVTLVGVVNADVALNLPDFRSGERTFQLLTQVAGRSGRGPDGGSVVVQTYNPEPDCVRLAKTHDYVSFAKSELASRKEHGYPPFRSLARFLADLLRGVAPAKSGSGETHLESAPATGLLFDDSDEEYRQEPSELISADTEEEPWRKGIDILGPAPAPLERIRGQYRYHIVLKASSDEALDLYLDKVLHGLKVSGGVRMVVDVDPLSML
jgi:primosomal protein N' (replication factor Y)